MRIHTRKPCRLSGLPELPQALEACFCQHNQITQLPLLSERLKTLDCSDNQLSDLPVLPTSLMKFYCQKNLIRELPDSMGLLANDCEINILNNLLPKDLLVVFGDKGEVRKSDLFPDTKLVCNCQAEFDLTTVNNKVKYINYHFRENHALSLQEICQNRIILHKYLTEQEILTLPIPNSFKMYLNRVNFLLSHRVETAFNHINLYQR